MIKFIEKYFGWMFKGTFYQVYLKWLILNILISLIVVSTLYHFKDIKDFSQLMKIEFFVSLYLALIPALKSRQLKSDNFR